MLFSADNCSTGIKAGFGNRCSNLLVQYTTSTWYSETAERLAPQQGYGLL